MDGRGRGVVTTYAAVWNAAWPNLLRVGDRCYSRGTMLHAFPTFADATHYASPTTADGEGDGSFGNPWSLGDACRFAIAGNVVGVFAGIYVGQPSGVRYIPSFMTVNSGTLISPIVFVAENQASIVSTGYSDIRSGGTVTGLGGPAFGSLTNDYVFWIGFYSDENAVNNKGFEDSGTAVLWTVKGGGIVGCKLLGEIVTFINNHAGIRLENCVSIVACDNEISGYNEQANGSGVNQAGVQTYETSDSIFEHNGLDDNGDGFHFKGREHTNNIVRLNRITNSRIAAFRIGGFVDDGTKRNLITENLCVDNAYDVELAYSATVESGVNGTDIVRNTFYAPSAPASSYGLHITDGQEFHDNTFKNNIVYRSGAAYYGTESLSISTAAEFRAYVDTDGNCLFGASNCADGRSGSDFDQLSLAEWQIQSAGDGNTIEADPLFNDAGNDDFTLDALSPALGMGCYSAGSVEPGIREL